MRIRFYVPCLLFEREVARNWRRYVQVQQRMRPALMGRNRSSLIDHVLLIQCACWQCNHERLSPELRSPRNDMRRDLFELGTVGASYPSCNGW